MRAAGGSVIASVIGDRLARNDPMGVTLFRQNAARLDEHTRRTLGAAADNLSNTLAAEAWLRERSATLQAAPSTPESPPAIPFSSMLLDQDGISGTRERLDEIEYRRLALTALNQQEFAANLARRRSNQTAIDLDTARSRAVVKTDTDVLYAGLRRHLTTGGPNGGPAITPLPVTITSRLAEEQQDAVTARINRAIAGIGTTTDPQTFYAIHQGLTGDDAGARDRWAAKNLTQFMGRLSDDDLAALEKLQAADDPEQRRLQAITRIANDTLRRAGIDPTPRPDASPGSDAEQAARFTRLVHDELSAFESRGRKLTGLEAYSIVKGLMGTAIKGSWIKPINHPADVQQASLAEKPSLTQTERETRMFGAPIDREPPPPPGTRPVWRPDFFIPDWPFAPSKPPPETPAPAFDNEIAQSQPTLKGKSE